MTTVEEFIKYAHALKEANIYTEKAQKDEARAYFQTLFSDLQFFIENLLSNIFGIDDNLAKSMILNESIELLTKTDLISSNDSLKQFFLTFLFETCLTFYDSQNNEIQSLIGKAQAFFLSFFPPETIKEILENSILKSIDSFFNFFIELSNILTDTTLARKEFILFYRQIYEESGLLESFGSIINDSFLKQQNQLAIKAFSAFISLTNNIDVFNDESVILTYRKYLENPLQIIPALEATEILLLSNFSISDKLNLLQNLGILEIIFTETDNQELLNHYVKLLFYLSIIINDISDSLFTQIYERMLNLAINSDPSISSYAFLFLNDILLRTDDEEVIQQILMTALQRLIYLNENEQFIIPSKCANLCFKTVEKCMKMNLSLTIITFLESFKQITNEIVKYITLFQFTRLYFLELTKIQPTERNESIYVSINQLFAECSSIDINKQISEEEQTIYAAMFSAVLSQTTIDNPTQLLVEFINFINLNNSYTLLITFITKRYFPTFFRNNEDKFIVNEETNVITNLINTEMPELIYYAAKLVKKINVVHRNEFVSSVCGEILGKTNPEKVFLLTIFLKNIPKLNDDSMTSAPFINNLIQIISQILSDHSESPILLNNAIECLTNLSKPGLEFFYQNILQNQEIWPQALSTVINSFKIFATDDKNYKSQEIMTNVLINEVFASFFECIKNYFLTEVKNANPRISNMNELLSPIQTFYYSSGKLINKLEDELRGQIFELMLEIMPEFGSSDSLYKSFFSYFEDILRIHTDSFNSDYVLLLHSFFFAQAFDPFICDEFITKNYISIIKTINKMEKPRDDLIEGINQIFTCMNLSDYSQNFIDSIINGEQNRTHIILEMIYLSRKGICF